MARADTDFSRSSYIVMADTDIAKESTERTSRIVERLMPKLPFALRGNPFIDAESRYALFSPERSEYNIAKRALRVDVYRRTWAKVARRFEAEAPEHLRSELRARNRSSARAMKCEGWDA